MYYSSSTAVVVVHRPLTGLCSDEIDRRTNAYGNYARMVVVRSYLHLAHERPTMIATTSCGGAYTQLVDLEPNVL